MNNKCEKCGGTGWISEQASDGITLAKRCECTCAKCDGTGWLSSKDADKLGWATRCDCITAERLEQSSERARIPPKFAVSSIANFIVPSQQENPRLCKQLNDVRVAVLTYLRLFPHRDNPNYAKAEELRRKRPGLLLWGGVGTGKTHLAVSVLRNLVEKDYNGTFMSYMELLTRMKASFDKAATARDKEAYSAAMDAEILLLDDLGANKSSEWVEETMTSLIEHRYNYSKPLIVTTNLSPNPEKKVAYINDGISRASYMDNLADRIGERANSRLLEMCRVVSMPAMEDYRLKLARALESSGGESTGDDS